MKQNETMQAASPSGDKGGMKLLIIRFSSLGDVAMTVPVVDSLARQYPDIDITVLTRTKFAAFFRSLPPIINFSNREFYNDKIRVMRKESSNDTVIDIVKVPEGKAYLHVFSRTNGSLPYPYHDTAYMSSRNRI